MNTQLSYPVDIIIPELLVALGSSNIVILSAPTGAGKTTRVPIAVLNSGILQSGKILMLEPRRLAARRAAEFMASQIKESVGETVGYRIRGENRTGRNTRIEVLTEGILTRMLQKQPDLPDVGLIIFDEFHERSIHADLGLAFSLDVQKHLREDLRILIMSATLDGEHLSRMLGNIPVIESTGRLFPIETRYSRFSSDKPLASRMAETILRALENFEGDVLAFLPGWREIQHTDQALYDHKLPSDVVVHTLHGEASSASQAQALAPAPEGKRKIILSTNVAETSLTIEGVRIVVDSGLVRVAQFDPRRGMSGLVTIPVSRASADQRRGRAGRLTPGVCYRLWTEAENVQLAAYSQPEIKSADLASFALDLAQWGSPNGENLLFSDPPPSANLQQAQSLLRNLETVDEAGALTILGRSMADLPVHPRLSHMILRAKEMGLGMIACQLAAILEERDLISGQKDNDVDLSTRWQEFRRGKGSARERAIAQARRLQQIVGIRDESEDDSHLGIVLALAYPERIAQRKDKNGNTYVMATGKQAVLPAGSKLSRHEFLVIADADIVGSSIRIYLCAPVTKDEIAKTYSSIIKNEDDIRWDSAGQRVVARRVGRLGAIILWEQDISADDERISYAMMEGIRELGLRVLPWNKESQLLRDRSEWLRSSGIVSGDWPDLRDTSLVGSIEQWLLPFLSGKRQLSHLDKLDMAAVLKTFFSFTQLRDLEHFAPSHVKLPSGSVVALDYSSGGQPVLAVRLQELFGQIETPRIGKGNVPVLIHLLSPARRPLAVTQDLQSFWKSVYPEIRNQMRAKYTKHVWPEDPLRAAPTNKTKRRQRVER